MPAAAWCDVRPDWAIDFDPTDFCFGAFSAGRPGAEKNQYLKRLNRDQGSLEIIMKPQGAKQRCKREYLGTLSKSSRFKNGRGEVRNPFSVGSEHVWADLDIHTEQMVQPRGAR